MATIISNDVETRDEYTATAGQTTFPYTFWAKEEDHIDVYVNGVLKTLTTDYTVSAVETDGGADVVFNSGLSLDDAVVITLNPDIERLADYQTSGNLKATTLNTELAYIVSLFQFFNTKISRSLSLNDSTTGVLSTVVPVAAKEVVGWNAAGTGFTTYSFSDISASIDTVLTSLTSGDLLHYDGTNWINTPFTSLSSGDFIQYNGTNWVNKTIADLKSILDLKKNNYSATAAPTANDDSDDGYAVGSRWFDVTNDNMYHCLDASVGAAVWQQGDVLSTDLGSAALATLIDDDSFATATASNIPSAESTKAYVDAQVSSIPFSSEFVSAEQTITYNSLLTVAHGLGSKPKLVQVVRICKTTEDGWAVGDEVIMQSTDLSGSYYGATVGYDATNVYITTGADITGHNKSTGAGVLTTASNWRYIVRAWS